MVKEKKDIVQKIKRRHAWKVVSVVLFALFIISLFTGGFKDFFGTSGVGSQTAAAQAVEYINTNLLQGRATANLQGVTNSEVDFLYKFNLEIGGQIFPSYVTKDGRYLIPQELIDITEELEIPQTPETPATGAATMDCEDTPKSDKPTVDMFVMSYCPYGTQAEKGVLPVLELLKDKIDFNLRFVYYAMHGETEVKEQLNQYCIQKEQNDKLVDYLYCFLEEGEGESCLTESGINKVKLEACVESADKEFGVTENLNDQSKWLNGRFPLFDIDKALNEKYGVGGSPSLVINGQTIRSGRDSASLLNALCCAFDEKPIECEKTLSTASPSPGFGFSASGSGSTGSCG